MEGVPPAPPARCPAYVLVGVDAAVAAQARRLAMGNGCFVILDRVGGAGRRLTLELNTGSRGRAIFLPGNPALPEEQAAALAECEQCWPACAQPILIQPS